MKKRILSILLMSAMLLGITGCNSGTEAPESTTTDSAEAAATTTAAKEDTAETTKEAVETEATTTTTETTTAAPELKLSLTSTPTMVMDGCMLISADQKEYMYNSTTNEMYEYDKNTLGGDIILISGNIACVGTDSDVNPANSRRGFDIVNLKTGELIVSAPADSEFSCYVPAVENTRPNSTLYPALWEDGEELIPVVSTEKSFSGDTVSLGVINNKGEWVLPMSSDYAICKDEAIKKSVSALNENYIVAGGTTVYDIKNDKIIPIDAAVKDYFNEKVAYYEKRFEETQKNSYANLLDKTGNIIPYYVASVISADGSIIKFTGKNPFGEENAFFTYDCENSEWKTVVEQYAISPENDTEYAVNYSYMDEASFGWYFKTGKNNDKVSCVLDKNFNTLDFDLSEYSVKEVYAATEKYIVFSARNEQKDTYKIIMKNDGSFVGEPFISDDNNVFISEDTVVVGNKIFDCTTGEMTEISFPIFYYVNTAGMMLVHSGDEYGLINPADPETLINPFEKADNIYTLN